MDVTPQTIKQMYRSQFTSFIRMAFNALHPNEAYQHGRYLEVLGDTLMRCQRGEIKRLIINMPPRHLKSLCASVAFPAWVLGNQPQTKIMCVSGHRGLAEDHHVLCRRLMTHPRYRAVFPHVRFTENRRDLRLPNGGYRSGYTASAGGGITGRGADLIIIDDPLSASEADDDQQRERVNKWYDQNIYQRLNDKETGSIIVVMQRLHIEDLTGHLLKQDGWEHLNLPAIAMEDECYPPLYGDKIIRHKGQPLQPHRENRQQLRDAMSRMGAIPFMAQYQQDPYPPGQRKERGGCFTVLPNENPTYDDLSFAEYFFGRMREKDFALEKVFGEYLGIVPGPPPPMDDKYLPLLGELKVGQSMREAYQRWKHEGRIPPTTSNEQMRQDNYPIGCAKPPSWG